MVTVVRSALGALGPLSIEVLLEALGQALAAEQRAGGVPEHRDENDERDDDGDDVEHDGSSLGGGAHRAGGRWSTLSSIPGHVKPVPCYLA